jgi:hypothetical protein
VRVAVQAAAVMAVEAGWEEVTAALRAEATAGCMAECWASVKVVRLADILVVVAAEMKEERMVVVLGVVVADTTVATATAATMVVVVQAV